MLENNILNDDELDEVSGGRFKPERKCKARASKTATSSSSTTSSNTYICKSCGTTYTYTPQVGTTATCPNCKTPNYMAD